MSRRLSLVFALLVVFAVTSLVTAQSPAPTSGALLVWIGEGSAPENRVPNSSSQVAALLPNGTLATLIEFDRDTIGVQRCTSQPFSADGRRFAFFASQPSGGNERGTLYQMTDFGTPVSMGMTHTLTCALDNFAYSPNGQRLAYIDYPALANNADNLIGTLRILNADNLREEDRFERTVAFSLTDTELIYLQFFPNADNFVDEVAVSLWDGQAGRELSAINARANCRFNGGTIQPMNDAYIGVLLGERCRGDSAVQWQFYLVDRETRASTLVLNGPQAGGYYPGTQTYNLYSTFDGAYAVFSVADGLARDTAAIYSIDMNTLAAPEPVVSRAAAMRRYVPLRFSLSEFAPAARSWDDRYLALGINPPEGAELAVIDFALEPNASIRIPISRAGDSVRAMAFSPDSTSLMYIAGGTTGADTSLYNLDLEMGIEARVARGQYAPAMAVRADKAVALLQYRLSSDATPRPYVDLLLVEPDGAQRELLSGLELNAEGQLQRFRFAVPLAWR